MRSMYAFQSTWTQHAKAQPRAVMHSNRVANKPVSISRPDNAAITACSFFPLYVRMYVKHKRKRERGSFSAIIRALSSRNYAAPFWCRIFRRLGPIENGHPPFQPPPPFPKKIYSIKGSDGLKNSNSL